MLQETKRSYSLSRMPKRRSEDAQEKERRRGELANKKKNLCVQ